MNGVVWHNVTPHEVTVLTLDEHGDIGGFIERGKPLKFKVNKVMPVSGPSVRLLSLHKFSPTQIDVDGVTITAYQPWTGENLETRLLPGKNYKTDHDPQNIERVYLVVSLPVADYMLQRAIRGGNLIARFTHTEVLCPDTGPGSCVRDENGNIIGVLGMKTFGIYYYPAPVY